MGNFEKFSVLFIVVVIMTILGYSLVLWTPLPQKDVAVESSSVSAPVGATKAPATDTDLQTEVSALNQQVAEMDQQIQSIKTSIRLLIGNDYHQEVYQMKRALRALLADLEEGQ